MLYTVQYHDIDRDYLNMAEETKASSAKNSQQENLNLFSGTLDLQSNENKVLR